MPLNEYRYLKKTDKGQQISLSTGKPKKKKQDKLTPYYHWKKKHGGKRHLARLEGSELKHHEIVYTKEGRPIPNPMASPGLTSLLPTSPLDLAFETLMTGASYAKGVDPRVAILAGIAAGQLAPKIPGAAKAVDVKSGAYLTERAIKKAFKIVEKDPMFKDIPFEEVSKFLIPSKLKVKGAGAYYDPSVGADLIRGSGDKGVFAFRNWKLSELISSPIAEGFRFEKPYLFNARKHWESTVRHEGRHFKQHAEGALQARPYSTLIEIPKPKNLWPGFTKDQINKNTGLPMKPAEFFEDISKKVGKSKAKKRLQGYIKKYERDVLGEPSESFLTPSYYKRHIEVEARLEEIASLGNKRRAYSDLIDEAGYSKKQVDDMVSDYKKAKLKKYPHFNPKWEYPEVFGYEKTGKPIKRGLAIDKLKDYFASDEWKRIKLY